MKILIQLFEKEKKKTTNGCAREGNVVRGIYVNNTFTYCIMFLSVDYIYPYFIFSSTGNSAVDEE